MKLHIYALLAGMLSLIACSQSKERLLGPKIVSTKTTSHQLIEGARIYMIAPPGFEPSKSMAGFEKADIATINVMDMDGISFETSANTLSKEKVEASNKQLLEEGNLTVNGIDAKYVRVNADGENHVIALVFGDSSYSIMLNCVYKGNDKETQKAIIKTIESVYFDKDQKPAVKK